MIAPAGLDDAETLARLHVAAFAHAWSESEIAKLLQTPTAFAFLARDREGAPRGFVLAWAAGGDSEVLTIAVAPEARRAGLGEALTIAAVAAAAARGAETMHLEAAEDNVAARALYEKLGFSEVGRRHGYYARADGAVDAVVMRKTLPAVPP